MWNFTSLASFLLAWGYWASGDVEPCIGQLFFVLSKLPTCTITQRCMVNHFITGVLTLVAPIWSCSCPEESISPFSSWSTILVLLLLLFFLRFLLLLLFALLVHVASICVISWFHWCLVETPKRTSSSSSKFGVLAIESLKLLVSLNSLPS